MNHLMETLEGRTLMSATLMTIFADEAKLQGDVQQMAAQLHQYARRSRLMRSRSRPT